MQNPIISNHTQTIDMTFRLREFIFRPGPKKIVRRQMVFFSGINAELIQKSVRNISISILPPDGRVRITAPLRTDISVVLRFASAKADWIRKHREKILQRPVQPRKKFTDGEVHDLLGKNYRLVLRQDMRSGAAVVHYEAREIHTSALISSDSRRLSLERLFRRELNKLIPGLISKWEPVMNVKVHAYGIKKMKTRWGTCNVKAQRIWLNLELAGKPVECLEYIVVHEMVHLLERNHTKRFYALMDRFMPEWKQVKKILDNALHSEID